jgi:hypothetical protein
VNPESKGYRLGHRFFRAGAEGEHAGKLWNFREPSTIVFPFQLQFQVHLRPLRGLSAHCIRQCADQEHLFQQPGMSPPRQLGAGLGAGRSDDPTGAHVREAREKCPFCAG